MRRWHGEQIDNHALRCRTGKKKSSKAQAMKEAKFLKYNKKYADTIPTSYVCKQCGFWHVGNL